MKMLISSRGLFALCFAVLAVTNIVVLLGVASNRSGEPDAQIILTERELRIPYRIQEENSGLALHLSWRSLGSMDDTNNYYDWRPPAWLNAEKLRELGFNLDDFLKADGGATFYKQPIPKEVFIVLENGGEPYKEAVRRAEMTLSREEESFKLNPGDKMSRDNFERAEKQLKREHIEKTRLFAIDAGLKANELRGKYSDRSRFIIVKGLVKPGFVYNKNRKELTGHIVRLSVGRINIPLKHRKTFDSIIGQAMSNRDGLRSPRFEVKLAYGSRLEPWIASVRHL